MRRSWALLLTGALALVLAGCTGLPTTGPVNAGLPIGEEEEIADPTPIAQGPMPGADPEDIVGGFLEASVTPAGDWETAQEFLTDEFADEWEPQAGVAIDESVSSRLFDVDVDPEDETATETMVGVQLQQVASVDTAGAYTASTGTSKRAFRLVRPEGGEWRIAEAPPGIVLDAASLEQVYRRYNLQYFDQSWSHLVPDVRWFPRRPSMATTITRALISGEPSEWLAPAVRTAFAEEIALAGDAVPVDSSQVAAVSLNRAALSATPVALARMRTQLEASLSGLGVSEVRFTVDGTPLEADTVSFPQPAIDGLLVLGQESFGMAVGDELKPIPALTAQIAKIQEPIAAIDVALDGSMAAVQMAAGAVFAVRDGATDRLDARAGLIAPSLDAFGFTWTVPRGDPSAVEAWDGEVVRHPVAQAWPEASSISHLRLSSDGARVAAVVTAGSQRHLVVAAVVRGEGGVPERLGDVREVMRLNDPAQGLAWMGTDSVVLLSNASDPVLITHVIGGPATFSTAPAGAKSLSGGKNNAAIRVLTSDGVVYAQRGSSWQESVVGARVLGTRAGY
ncbi:LpqB family beta-propeller domain-containing protein [Microbacterium sp.]|uniref:LpqB family beta-propeller domain-containing protein n=1 Tax=Microbacterium sp. TaxID=51671 RepID=UPI002810E1FB|nr:LpqB family beta-propeller domain-containing protein [Microbacterium sp.]